MIAAAKSVKKRRADVRSARYARDGRDGTESIGFTLADATEDSGEELVFARLTFGNGESARARGGTRNP